MKKEFLEIGKVVGTHGVRGEMRVQLWCDNIDFFKQFKTLYSGQDHSRTWQVLSCRAHGSVALLGAAGIEDRDAAAAMRGTVLSIRREDAKLPEGQYFIAELIGCTVTDADDETIQYGTLTDISETGANDVWHITDEQNRTYLIPAIPSVVIDTNIDTGMIKIRPLKGIFSDED